MKYKNGIIKKIIIATAVASLPACEHTAVHELIPIGSCYLERYTQPIAPQSPKVDLLFVTDSSGSLDAEKTNLADGIDAFVAELPANTNYRIAVMLAHGSKSKYSGALFKAKTEPTVLNSQSMSLATIRSNLKTKLLNTADDSYSDGGEEGLYSLNLAMDPAPLAASQAKGFFRSDATLAVVFASV